MTEPATALPEIRRHIDALDRQIVALIAERQRWVVEAGRLKKDEDGVRAPDRVEQVVRTVRRVACEVGAAPDVVEQAYRAMIAGFVGLELEVHRSA